MSNHARIQTFGFAGLIPFIGFSLTIWFVPQESADSLLDFFLSYSVVILSFLAGLLWAIPVVIGSNLRQNGILLNTGIVYSLLAWASTIFKPALQSAILGLSFIALRSVEKKFCDHLYETMFAVLRDRLTIVVTLAHLSAFSYAVFLGY